MFDKTPTKAHMLVNAVLNHLYDRRPFKYDLPAMESDHPDLWEEMMEEMRDSAQRVLDKGDYRE